MSSRFLILLATVLFSGCASLPAPAPMGAPPILRTTPVAPEATTIMRCLGERLGRHRAGLPPLLGYLLSGILIGPFTPGFVADVELSKQLAEIGVILLMFGVGMHFSVGDLLAVRNIALPGAVVTIAGTIAAAFALLWMALWRLTGNPAAAWVAWAAVALTAPTFFHGFTIYPDGVGAASTAVGLWMLAGLEQRRTFTRRTTAAVGAALALLPWLHTRFALVAGVLGAVILLRLIASPSLASETMGARLRNAAAFLMIPAVAAAPATGGSPGRSGSGAGRGSSRSTATGSRATPTPARITTGRRIGGRWTWRSTSTGRGIARASGGGCTRRCCRGTWRSSTRSTAGSSTTCAAATPAMASGSRGFRSSTRRRGVPCGWPTWRRWEATR